MRSTRQSSKRAESRLVVTLLGAPRAEIDGVAVRTDTRKAIALLALLALSEQPQRRSTLASYLWPDADETRARGALRRTLSVLRSALGDRWLTIDGETVGLDSAGLVIDVRDLRRALSEGRPADAVALYRGDLLQGFSLKDSPTFDEWQATQAETLRGETSGALDRVAAEAEARGDTEGAIAFLRKRLELDPLHEPAHRALMRAYARSGDRGAALRQFHECARRLDAELGVAPASETRSLYEAIERGELPDDALVASPTTAEAVADVHVLHGDYRRAIEKYAEAAKASPSRRAAIEHKVAQVHHRRGDWAAAERHYAMASQSAATDGDRARFTADWSSAAHRAGDTVRARRLAGDALVLAERSKDERALAQAHNILGILESDARRSRAHFETSAALAQRLGDRAAHVAALNNLALAQRRAGDLERARALTDEALTECEAIGDRHRAAALHNNLADIHRAMGNEPEAMRHLKRAVRIFADIGDAGEPEIWKLVEW